MPHHYGCDCAGLQRQLQQAQEATDRVVAFANIGLADLRKKRNQVIAERDEAIERHRRDVGTAWRWFNTARMVAHDRRLRAEAAEALAETRLSNGVFLYHAVKLVTERGVGIQYKTPAEAQKGGD